MSGCNCSSDSCSDGSCSSGSCSDGTCGSDRLPPGMLKIYDLDQETSDGILVFIELIEKDGKLALHPSVRSVLGHARKITDGRLFGAMFASADGRELYDEIYSFGVDSLYHMRNPAVTNYQPGIFSKALIDLVVRINPAAMLFSATHVGRELAPLVSAGLNVGLTADCTVIESKGRDLIMKRPALGGNIIATIVSDKYPNMATVRPGVLPEPVPETGRKGSAIAWPYKCTESHEIIETKTPEKGHDIANSKILISLGNGIRNRDSVDYAYYIADKIGASVSCSRAIVDRGWMPLASQVGQSGRTVSPEIYIAFGISGSVQHMAGIRSERIVSINKDKTAPINSHSEKVLIGDADEILRRWKISLEN